MDRSCSVTVAAVVHAAGRFLVVEERIGHRLLLNQPAGHVEAGETLLAAVARETLEETAWHFEPLWLIGAYRWRHPARQRAFLRFAFAGRVSGHEPGRPLDSGIVRARWLTAGELTRRRARLRSPLVLRCLGDYLAGRRRPLEDVGALDLHGAAAWADRSGARGAVRVR